MKRLFLFFLFSFLGLFHAQEYNNQDSLDDVPFVRGYKPMLTDTDSSEGIVSFHSDITVHKDASLTVIETIKINSLGNDFKRGIFRSFPSIRNLNGKTERVKFKIISVKKDGVKEHYSTKYEDEKKTIYIGDKDTFLDPGQYTYEITYETPNQIGFFDKYDELYWNVNGMAWDFHINKVTSTVHLPEGAKILQNSCYTGAQGSTANNCSSQIISDTEIQWDGGSLGKQQNLTIAVGFQKGIVMPPSSSFVEKYGISIFLVLAFAGLLFYGYISWKKYGIDPKKPVVYPQFNVPEDMSPAELGYIYKESYNSSYITASLVNLAVKKYIVINEISRKEFGSSVSKIYEISKIKEPDPELAKEERSLMKDLFKTSSKIKLDGEYKSKVGKAVRNFESNLLFKHESLIKEGNNTSKVIWPSVAVFGISIITFLVTSFIEDNMYQLRIEMPKFVFIFIFFIITMAISKKVERKRLGCIVFLAVFFLSFFVRLLISPLTEDKLAVNSKTCFLFLIAGIVFLFVYRWLIKKPSEEKLRKQSLIEGFKMYMGAAENEVIKFHNPPQMTPEIFETYLPYAMVLGVDKIWGKKFQDMLDQSSVEYTNDWYTGTTMGFSGLGSTLNSSLTNSIQSTSTSPSSSGSGSSSSSGSSGGGFSGGGGGGGGGGGW